MALYPYQLRAIEQIRSLPSAGVFAECGLGKTAIACHAIGFDLIPAIVLAPSRVAAHTWPAELAKWRPELKISVAIGSPAQRKAKLAPGADVYIMSQDSFHPHIADLRALHAEVLIIDESSGYKSQQTRRWKGARKLARNIPHVWAMSGTPAPNTLIDLWAQLFLLDQGAALGKTLGEYRRKYFTPGYTLPSGVVTQWRLNPGADAKIHKAIAPICFHLAARDYLDLPPITINRVPVVMPPKTTQIYRKLENDFVADLTSDGGSVHSAATAATLSNRLSQAAAGFLYPDTDTPDDPIDVLDTAKLDALGEILDDGHTGGVFVLYRYKQEAAAIKQRFPQARFATEPGVLDRWNAGQVPVLLGHPASVGMGLNLQQGGHTIVWTTLSWSLQDWIQANDRLMRQGQPHPVMVHVLQAVDTIDEVIYAAIVRKQDTQEALLEYLKKKKETK